jgi:hypothetical protein
MLHDNSPRPNLINVSDGTWFKKIACLLPFEHERLVMLLRQVLVDSINASVMHILRRSRGRERADALQQCGGGWRLQFWLELLLLGA